MVPVCSVDGRERDFRQGERWSDENVFANRAYFIPEKQPAELGIDHIRETDQHIYRCRVDFKIAQTRNSKVNLTIIGKWNFCSISSSVILLEQRICVNCRILSIFKIQDIRRSTRIVIASEIWIYYVNVPSSVTFCKLTQERLLWTYFWIYSTFCETSSKV